MSLLETLTADQRHSLFEEFLQNPDEHEKEKMTLWYTEQQALRNIQIDMAQAAEIAKKRNNPADVTSSGVNTKKLF
jgi:hypothetical protein